MINRYSKIWNAWHREFQQLYGKIVVIQEKYDGSQISFRSDGMCGWYIRSKNCEIKSDNVPKIFKPTVDTILNLMKYGKLEPNWTYRAEAFCGPRHNTLTYSRTPWGNMVLYDVEDENGAHLSPEAVSQEAHRLGVDCAHTLAVDIMTEDFLKHWNDKLGEIESSLGGHVEGIVIKAYGVWDTQGHCLMGKLVDNKFREKHKAEFQKADVITRVIGDVNKERLWEKAVQRLDEEGVLTGEMKDIPEIMKDINTDFLDEEEDAIRDKLFKIYWRKISKRITDGMPQWYKQKLIQMSMEK